MTNSCSYMNEHEIDDELKCVVCRQPFHEPVYSINCHHTFCKKCISDCINQERRCPVCRTHSDHGDYHPIKSRALMNQLNRLRVYCNACEVGNIQYGDFQAHTQTCCKWIIPCTAADIRCTWKGMRHQFANHVKNCPFQNIRPIVDDLRGQISNLQGQIQSHSQQINELQGKTQSHNNQINILQDNLKYFIPIFVFFATIVLFMFPSSEKNRQPLSLTEKIQGLFNN